MTVKEVRQIIKQAEFDLRHNIKTILFLDEIHRFSKSQQDSLLKAIEEGILGFIGTTTHNPLFCLTRALISRSQIFYFNEFSESELEQLIHYAISHPKGFPNTEISIDENSIKKIIKINDSRKILHTLEYIIQLQNPNQSLHINEDIISSLKLDNTLGYNNEEHYDFISAYIKSMRHNQVDEAIYWLARMLKSGEDPLFIARRLVIFASEDIGNADPRALTLSQSSFDACVKIGMPESRIILSQATSYCATAPKSRSSYNAINTAMQDVQNKSPRLPEKHRLNKTSMRKNQDIQKKSQFPKYYQPIENGYEKYIKQRMQTPNNTPE